MAPLSKCRRVFFADSRRRADGSFHACNAAMAWETERKRPDPARLERGIAGVFARPQRGFYLIAERDGATIGNLMVTYEWSGRRCGDFWWIQSVYVTPAA